MADFAWSYINKTDMKEEEFAENHSSTPGGVHSCSSSTPIQTTAQKATSFVKMLQLLDEAFGIYQNALQRGADPSHIQFLRKSYESLIEWTSSVRNDINKQTISSRPHS